MSLIPFLLDDLFFYFFVNVSKVTLRVETFLKECKFEIMSRWKIPVERLHRHNNFINLETILESISGGVKLTDFKAFFFLSTKIFRLVSIFNFAICLSERRRFRRFPFLRIYIPIFLFM